MAAANSSGGVMGKMVDAQSIVVASTATRWYGHEGEILRYVFFHSVILAILVGALGSSTVRFGTSRAMTSALRKKAHSVILSLTRRR